MILIPFLMLANIHQKEGYAFGKALSEEAFSKRQAVHAEEILPEEERGKVFDPKQARSSEAADYLTESAVQSNRMHIEKEHFLDHAEDMIAESGEYQFKSCQFHDAPYPLSLIRDLQVEVTYDPGEKRAVKVCQGHEARELYSKQGEAKKAKATWERRLASDPTVQHFKVEIYKEHRWRVKPQWIHHEESSGCDCFLSQMKTIRESSLREAGDTWVYQGNADLGKSPHCRYLHATCLDKTPSKEINGKQVYRPCWREQITFLCQLPNTEECPFFKNSQCDLINKKCLTEGDYGCVLWELTFKCYSSLLKVSSDSISLPTDTLTYEPNDSFSEVMAKLAVFDSIKKELESTQFLDAKLVQVFKGKKMECSKSIAEKALYDCCFNFSGLAKEAGLTHCSQDEIALSEMREQGLCYYVGSYDGKIFNLKSRDEHVFCCFDSKLARILQQNARPQLALDWGVPKQADCRGLSLEEISRLDFTLMDFSELYSEYGQKLPEAFQSKLNAFENRIREKIHKQANT